MLIISFQIILNDKNVHLHHKKFMNLTMISCLFLLCLGGDKIISKFFTFISKRHSANKNFLFKRAWSLVMKRESERLAFEWLCGRKVRNFINEEIRRQIYSK